MFTQHASPKLAESVRVRSRMSTVQPPAPAKWPWADYRSSPEVSGSSPVRGCTKWVTQAQLLRRQASDQGTQISSLLAGPLSGTKPHTFGRAQLYPCEQVNKRLSSV